MKHILFILLLFVGTVQADSTLLYSTIATMKDGAKVTVLAELNEPLRGNEDEVQSIIRDTVKEYNSDEILRAEGSIHRALFFSGYRGMRLSIWKHEITFEYK